MCLCVYISAAASQFNRKSFIFFPLSLVFICVSSSSSVHFTTSKSTNAASWCPFVIQVFFSSSFFFFWLFHPYLTSPPLFSSPLAKKKGGITNLVFRLIPPRPLETVTSPPSPRLSLGLSSVEKHPSLSLSLFSISISHCLSPSLPLALSPPARRPLTRSRQLQRSVCLLCRSSVRL